MAGSNLVQAEGGVDALKLALVASHTRNGVVLADAHGRVEWVNAAFTRITGYTLDDIAGKTPGSVLQGPATDRAVVAEMARSFRDGIGFLVELINYGKNGRPYWVSVEVRPVRDAAGAITQWVGIQTDITSRKRAERHLKAQLDVIRVLAERRPLDHALPRLVHVIAEILDAEEAEYWSVDPASQRLSLVYRKSRDEGVVRPIDPDGETPSLARGEGEAGAVWLAGMPLSCSRVDSSGSRRATLGLPVGCGSETYGVLLCRGNELPPLDTDLENLVVALGQQIGQFIEREAAAVELARSNAYLETLLEAATHVSVIATDLSGRITVFNHGAERMLGYRREEMVGLATPERIHLPEEVEAQARRLLEEDASDVSGFDVFVDRARRGDPEVREWTYVRKDGERLTVELAVNALRAKDGAPFGYLGMAVDMTARRRAEAELRLARDRLEERVQERTAEIERAVGRLEAEIADRVRAEERLRDSEQRFRFLANSMPQVVWTATPTGEVDYYNRRWCDLTALPEGIRGDDSWVGFIHPQDLEPTRAAWSIAVRTGTPLQLANRVRVRGGDPYRWQLVRALPFFGDDGQIAQWVGTCTDIDEQKHIEEALRASEERCRMLAEAMPQLVWSGTPDGRCDYISRQWLAYTGLPEQELVGTGWLKALHPDDRDAAWATWESAVRARETYDAVYRIRRLDGTYRWFQARGLPLREESGQVVQWLGTCTDIDDRVQAEEALRRAHDELEARVRDRTAALEQANQSLQIEVSERRRAEAEARERQHFVERLAEANPSILYLCDLRSRRTAWVNRRVLDVLGFDPGIIGEMSGPELRSLVHPDDQGSVGIAEIRRRLDSLEEGQVVESECRMRHADGTWRWLRRREVVFRRDAAGVPEQILGVAEDVTERKHAEDTFRVLFEKSTDAHLLYDEHEGLIDCNEATLTLFACDDRARILGVHPERLAAASQPDGVSAWTSERDYDTRARRIGFLRFDWWMRRFNGEVFPCEVTLRPVDVAGRSLLLMVAHDLSERHDAAEDLRRAKEVAEAATAPRASSSPT
ncbi:MAG: PAS domain S-box protein [Isosphaeraceae bacterium]